MAQTYSRSNGKEEISTVQPECKHGGVILLHSTTTVNPGRRFWRCPLMQGGCNRFMWFERPYEGSVKRALLVLATKYHEADSKRSLLARVNNILLTKISSMREEMKAKVGVAKEERENLQDCLWAVTMELEETLKKKESERVKLEAMVEGVREEMDSKLAVVKKETSMKDAKLRAMGEELQECLSRANEDRRKMEALMMKNFFLEKDLKRSNFCTVILLAMVMFWVLAKVMATVGAFA